MMYTEVISVGFSKHKSQPRENFTLLLHGLRKGEGSDLCYSSEYYLVRNTSTGWGRSPTPPNATPF